MYDMTQLKKKSWEITFIDGRVLNILTPKMNMRYEVVNLLNDTTDYLKSMSNAISKIASNNKENITITVEEVERLMDEEEMTNFIDAFTNWLTGVTNDPN